MTTQSLLGVGTDHALYIRWDLASGWQKLGHSENVMSTATRTDGTTIAAGVDNNLYVHQPSIAPNGYVRETAWTGPVPNSASVISIATRPDNTLLGVGGNHLLYQWDYAGMQWGYIPTNGKVISIAVTKDNVVIGVSEDYRLCMLSAANQWVFCQCDGQIKSVAAMADGTTVGVAMAGDLWTLQGLTGHWIQIPNSGVVTSIAAVPVGVNIGAWRSPPVNNDPEAGSVSFRNLGAFDCYFSVQWNGGQSARTPLQLNAAQTTAPWVTVNLYNVPDGASCWARVYVSRGVTHDSGRNFNYVKGAPAVSYTVTGGLATPSFD